MSFESVIGQKDLKQRIGAFFSGNLPQSFLITGTKGMGKTVFSEELAKSVLCMERTPSGSCGTCASCRYFEAGTHPDIKRINAEDKSNITVAELREKIIGDQFITPQISSSKVYIINGDELREEGQNLLLKSIEEPPSGTYFIIKVSSSDLMLPTIRSRVTELKLAEYSVSEIMEILRRQFGQTVSDEKMKIAAEFCSGVPGRATDLLGDEDLETIRDEMLSLVTGIADLSYTDILYTVYPFFEKNKDRVEMLLVNMLWILGDVSVFLSLDDPPGSSIMNRDKDVSIKSFAESHRYLSQMKIGKACEHISELRKMLSLNVNFETACCGMLIKVHKELAR
ncbi:MAG: hypothetical protein J5685_03420 [Clostridiales bacterium]|nr:hypothetical protein [Clostridiales bacterium]